MKCTIPEISWHNRDPVLSLDIQPVQNENIYRLASGGTDSHVLIWHLRILETGATTTEAVSDLTRHQRAVNVVRWSPSGQYLASGDDDANIIIWHQKSDDLAILLDGDTGDKEKWSVFKVLRGHKEDVYDICWSPDSTKLISGSVDNSAIIWSLAKGNNENILQDHKGFVQGVTWDPLGQFVATLSSDRTFRVFTETGKKVKCRTAKGCLPVPETHPLHNVVVRYYHDDTLKSFFRRLTFSPDGNLVITPTGCLETGDTNKLLYTTYIYTVASLSQPVAILPSPSQYTVAARCCPILFELWPNGPDSIIDLPYRMVIAVATRSSVILYDTQQATPFAVISNIHYTRLTDLTWSHDGRLLAVSSTDGFCSLVTFEVGELGKQYFKEPDAIVDTPMEELPIITTEVEIDIALNNSVDEKKDRRPSFLDQWATKTPKSTQQKTANTVELEHEKENKKVQPAQNSVAAKPIAIRRKPRTAEQVNITHFLKTPQSPKIEVKSQPVSYILEDSVAQDAWNNENSNDTKAICVLNNEPILIEDSQDIKLVIEESTLTEIKDTPTEEKMEVDIVEYSNKTGKSKDSTAEQDVIQKCCAVSNANINTCPETKPVHHKDPLENKKRVPLITLSSPKHKKKPF